GIQFTEDLYNLLFFIFITSFPVLLTSHFSIVDNVPPRCPARLPPAYCGTRPDFPSPAPRQVLCIPNLPRPTFRLRRIYGICNPSRSPFLPASVFPGRIPRRSPLRPVLSETWSRFPPLPQPVRQ